MLACRLLSTEHAPNVSDDTKPSLDSFSGVQQQNVALDKCIDVVVISSIAFPHSSTLSIVFMLLDSHEIILILNTMNTSGLKLGADTERTAGNVFVGNEACGSVDDILNRCSACGAREESCFNGELEHVGLGDVIGRDHVDADAVAESRRAKSAEEA